MKTHASVVIVEGYSAGNLLAPEFSRRGVQAIHVQMTDPILPLFIPSYRPNDYIAHCVFRGAVDQLAAQLSAYHPIAVIAGTETGVELADALAHQLGIRGNPPSLSPARRDKFLMGEAVRSAGIPCARQCRVSAVEQALEWKSEQKLDRVVVKPLASAGTDGVRVCRTEEEVRLAVSAIVGQTNRLGLLNAEALVQELLVGTEYFLNSVSVGGTPFFTDVWRYQKRSINQHSFVYDCNLLCSPHDPVVVQLQEYVAKVLNALGIHEGAAHTEVMWTEQGPRLVEVGARLDGLSVPEVNLRSTGVSPASCLADSALDPLTFPSRYQRHYERQKHARTVYLTSYQEGLVSAIPGESRIRELPSFLQMRIRVQPGGKIGLTTNYFSAPGFVSLVHPDADQVEADYQAIRSLETRHELFYIN